MKNELLAQYYVDMRDGFLAPICRIIFLAFVFEKEEDRKSLKTVKRKFEENCNQRNNVVFERYLYWKCVQQDEAIDQYITHLRQKIKLVNIQLRLLMKW